MSKIIKATGIFLLVMALAGCSLLPTAGTSPTPTQPTSEIPPSSYEPQPGDEKLSPGEVFLELDKSSLLIMESYPIQVNAILNGNLPDPCHQLRVVVATADAENRINLKVYSLVDPAQTCLAVLQPFTATIPLGSYADGKYSVYVNDELLGEFEA